MKNRILVTLFWVCSAFCLPAQTITTVAGSGSCSAIGDGGMATDAELLHPIGIVFDAVGNYYITDRDHDRVRKVTPAGIITTIAGTGVSGYNGDNGPATAAKIDFPYGSGPLLEQNTNAVQPDYTSTQFFKRSKDSLSARKEFTNSITCVGLVLRATKSVYASRINMPSIHELRVFGIGYEHKVYRNVNIGAGYYVWKQFSPWFNDVSVNCEPQAIVAGHERGIVQRLNKYKMFDVFGKYFLNRGHHQIDAGIGFSYTWGDNTVIDSIFSYPGHDVIISHHESANYGGVFVLIGYHYYFLHNRLSIGYEINWRNYFGIYSPFLQNGLSARFRF